MRTSWLEPLIAEIESPGLISRTGIALVRDDGRIDLTEYAARAGLDSVDFVRWKLDSIDPRQRFLSMTTTSLIDDMDQLCSVSWFSRCLVVTNAEIALARLSATEVGSFWHFLFESFRRRPIGLIVAMSHSAAEILLPADERERWLIARRLVEQGGDTTK